MYSVLCKTGKRNYRPWVHRRAFFATILFGRPEKSRLQKRRSKELTDPLRVAHNSALLLLFGAWLAFCSMCFSHSPNYIASMLPMFVRGRKKKKGTKTLLRSLWRLKKKMGVLGGNGPWKNLYFQVVYTRTHKTWLLWLWDIHTPNSSRLSQPFKDVAFASDSPFVGVCWHFASFVQSIYASAAAHFFVSWLSYYTHIQNYI